MLPEDKVPIEQRLLVVAGIVSPRVLAVAKDGLESTPSANGRVFFLMFSYADLPIGKEFAFACPSGRAQEAVPTQAVISAVTQQWGKPLREIPHGWKTIALIEFPKGVPELIDSLPVIDDWYTSTPMVALLNEATLHACFRGGGDATVQQAVAADGAAPRR